MLFIFRFFDSVLAAIPENIRFFVALTVIVLLIWSCWRILKGYFIYIIVILILFPSIWPALKVLGTKIMMLFGYILYRL